jgi:hypothetical protein
MNRTNLLLVVILAVTGQRKAPAGEATGAKDQCRVKRAGASMRRALRRSGDLSVTHAAAGAFT